METRQADETGQNRMLNTFFTIVRRHARRRRRAWQVFWSAWGVMMVFSILCGRPYLNLYAGAIAILSMVVMIIVPLSTISSHKVKKAMLQVAESDDLSIIGPLLESAEGGNGNLQPEALIALAHLMPRLKASDAPLLSDNHRKRIYRYWSTMHLATNLLNGTSKERDGYTEFVIAALRALEQIGDSTAVRYITDLAEYNPNFFTRQLAKDARLAKIREAAQACLPALQLRLEQQKSQQGLLRPSSASEATSGTLLHPAHVMAHTEPQQLLRISNSPSTE